MKKIGVILGICLSVNVCGAGESQTAEANVVSLEKYENGVATFNVGVCLGGARIIVDVKFVPSSNKRLTYAELSFQVPKYQCLANSYQSVVVDVAATIKEAAAQKGITSQYLLIKSIPNRIEIVRP